MTYRPISHDKSENSAVPMALVATVANTATAYCLSQPVRPTPVDTNYPENSEIRIALSLMFKSLFVLGECNEKQHIANERTVDSRQQVIGHDSQATVEAFQAADGKGLHDIEQSEDQERYPQRQRIFW